MSITSTLHTVGRKVALGAIVVLTGTASVALGGEPATSHSASNAPENSYAVTMDPPRVPGVSPAGGLLVASWEDGSAVYSDGWMFDPDGEGGNSAAGFIRP